ncbi:MAG: hypothetical protein M1816_006071 [Peltula sp. TS41687]|nr:MAG: hypothetical protein M1816_006071 [Peltula sp. TS41687]
METPRLDQVPKFSGLGIPAEDASEYIETIEYLSGQPPVETICKIYLRHGVTERAKEWYGELTKAVRQDWQQPRQRFLERFDDDQNHLSGGTLEYSRRILALQQKDGQTLTEYVKEASHLSEEGPATLQKDLAQQFLAGIKDDNLVRWAIKELPDEVNYTFSDAKTALVKATKLPGRPSPFDQKEEHQASKEHSTPDDLVDRALARFFERMEQRLQPARNPYNGNSHPLPPNPFRNNGDPTQERPKSMEYRPLSNVECFKCHQIGHYANFCPEAVTRKGGGTARGHPINRGKGSPDNRGQGPSHGRGLTGTTNPGPHHPDRINQTPRSRCSNNRPETYVNASPAILAREPQMLSTRFLNCHSTDLSPRVISLDQEESYQAAPVTNGRVTKHAPKRTVRIQNERATSLPPEQTNIHESIIRAPTRQVTPPGILRRENSAPTHHTQDAQMEAAETMIELAGQNQSQHPTGAQAQGQQECNIPSPHGQQPVRQGQTRNARHSGAKSQTPRETIPINLSSKPTKRGRRPALQATPATLLTVIDEGYDEEDSITCLYIEAWVGGVKVNRTLVDTGAVVELISPTLVQRIPGLTVHEMTENWSLRLADDKKVPITHYVTLEVIVAGIRTVLRAYVMGYSETFEFLLSKNWMTRVKAIEDHGKGTLTIHGKTGKQATIQAAKAESPLAELIAEDEYEGDEDLAEQELSRLTEELDEFEFESEKVEPAHTAINTSPDSDPSTTTPIITDSVPITARQTSGFPVKRRPAQRPLSTDPQQQVHEWFEASAIDLGAIVETEHQRERAERLFYTWRGCFVNHMRDVKATDLIEHAIDILPNS